MDGVRVRILYSIIKINVPVEKDKCPVIVANFSVGFTSIKEGLVTADLFGVPEERGGLFCDYFVEFVLLAFSLQKQQVCCSQEFHELLVNNIVLIGDFDS